MALTSAQIVSVAEITRESYATIEDLVLDLNAAQETILLADLTTWAAIRDSHVKLKGGKDGIDFDNARKRAAIFYRIRNMLGLEWVSYDLECAGEFFEIVELETGVNFG